MFWAFFFNIRDHLVWLIYHCYSVITTASRGITEEDLIFLGKLNQLIKKSPLLWKSSGSLDASSSWWLEIVGKYLK